MREEKEDKDSWVSWLSGETVEIPEEDLTEDSNFRDLQKTWDLAGTAYSYRNADQEKAWSDISEKIGEPQIVRVKRLKFLRYAAVIAALFTLGSILFLLVQKPGRTEEQLTSAKLSMKSVRTETNPVHLTTLTLPDGTTVTLNAQSEIQYPEKFSASGRIVKLSGEAFFDVVHDASHPFVVETGEVRVEDLGTSFNVSAYPGRNQVEVNVTSGSVRLRDRQNRESTIIPAGSRGKYSSTEGNMLVSGELTANFRSWITKEIAFRHTPLSEVFDQLENIYHVPIEFSDQGIAGIAYTANFDKFELDDIVDVIAKTHHLSVSKKDGRIVFATR